MIILFTKVCSGRQDKKLDAMILFHTLAFYQLLTEAAGSVKNKISISAIQIQKSKFAKDLADILYSAEKLR